MENKKRILLVEDEAALLYALQSRLSLEGFSVEAVSTGKSAAKSLEKGKFDLIILDIILPDTDGFTILKKIKDDPSKKDIPCVILSNLSKKENMEKGISLGAKDFLPKNEYKLDEIIEKIKTFF